jgi:hypothetical protein
MASEEDLQIVSLPPPPPKAAAATAIETVGTRKRIEMAGFLKLVLADDHDDFRVTRSGGIDLRQGKEWKDYYCFPLGISEPHRLRISTEKRHSCKSCTLEFSLVPPRTRPPITRVWALAIETPEIFLRIKETGSAGLLPADVKEVRFWVDEYCDQRCGFNDVTLQVRLFPCTGEAPFVQKIPLLLVID